MLYLLILFLGSLHPLESWQWPLETNWLTSFESETRFTPQNDLVINFLIYIPLAVLMTAWSSRYLRGWRLFFSVVACLSLVSLTIECLQIFIPSRAQSFVDFGLNTIGAITGTTLYLLFSRQNALGRSLLQWRYTLFHRGRLIDLGLFSVAAWILSELAPFLPGVDWQTVASNLSLLKLGIQKLPSMDTLEVTETAFKGFVIFYLLGVCLRRHYAVLSIGLGLGLFVLWLKLPIQGTSAKLEQFIGLIIAAFGYFSLEKRYNEHFPLVSIYAALLAYSISQLHHPLLALTQETKHINLIPFYFPSNRLIHIREILETIWVTTTVGFLIRNSKLNNVRLAAIIGIIVIGVAGLSIEWAQQNLQMTAPDITHVIIAIAAWAFPFLHPRLKNPEMPKPLP